MEQYRVVVDSKITLLTYGTLTDCIRVAEKYSEVFNTKYVKIEGYKTGDLTIDEAKKIANQKKGGQDD